MTLKYCNINMDFNIPIFYFQFLFNKTMLPPCMFHKDFQVFGVHIYLQDKERLLCTRVGDLPERGGDQQHSLQENQSPRTVIYVNSLESSGETPASEENIEQSKIDRDSTKSRAPTVDYINTLLYMVTLMVIFCNRQWR